MKNSILIIMILILSFCNQAIAKENRLIVFAAASTTELLREIKTTYLKDFSSEINISLASSSTLAKQIESGAPAHIFISANSLWMDYLEKKGNIRKDSRFNIMKNSLCLITNIDRKEKFSGFENEFSILNGRLAMGDPDHVPAGIYARQALIRLGLWKDLKTEIAAANTVKHALLFVENGECEKGIVYKTDALNNKKVKILKEFPDNSHDSIIYPVAEILIDHPEQKRFMKFLKTTKIRNLIRRYGFIPGDNK